MNKSTEVQAKTLDQAIEQALQELGASYDEVDVEVLTTGGLFKKAKVKVTVKGSAETVVEKPAAEEKKTDRIVNEKTQTDAKKTTDKPVSTQTEKPKFEKKHTETKAVVVDGEMPEKLVKAFAFTKKLFELLGNDSEVVTEMTDKSLNINVNGGNVGMIIGKGGEVMNAIQTLVSSIAIAYSRGEGRRVYLNVEDYKQRREETLKALAVKKAEKVKETGRYIKLEPMNARERAIIHSALQDIEGVRSYSTGKDPHRCLCIAPAEQA
jgi:spoIIIJ-associated protein